MNRPDIARIASMSLALLLASSCGPPPAPVASASEPGPRTGPTTGGEEQTSRPSGRAPSSREAAAIHRLERQATRLRELDFVRTVDTRIHTQGEIQSFLRAQMTDASTQRAVRVYAGLGLLPADMDVMTLVERVLTEQVVGYYDPDSHRLVVREDAARSLQTHTIGGQQADQGRLTLLHELVHALQDQQLGLGELNATERSEDASLAFRSLVEGDATLAMIGHAIVSSGGSLELVTANVANIRRLLASSMENMPGQELSAAPTVIRMSLLAPYLYGLVFTASLHHHGGWAAVNAAYTRLPASMEQVLHPEKYLLDERPDAYSPPEIEGLIESGFALAFTETLGELEMAVYFGLASEEEMDEAAAAGWSGDYLQIFGHEEERDALLWWTVWDNLREAQQAEQAANEVQRGLSNPEREGCLVTRNGRALLIARGLPQRFHLGSRDALERLSASLTNPQRESP